MHCLGTQLIWVGEASAAALAPYVPTPAGRGDDPTADSSTWTATSRHMTEDGDRDPTLDFGFVTPSASIGDLVWIDEDGDGIQDPGEPGIPGVVLTITGPDGAPVTDVYGNPVGPVTTGPDGSYRFDGLPLGVAYTVTIDRDASAAALEPYMPTIEGLDSWSWTATSRVLGEHGEYDGTLDFGFVLTPLADDEDRDPAPDPAPVPGPAPTRPVEPLPRTGGDPTGPIKITLLLFAAGATLIVAGRRIGRTA